MRAIVMLTVMLILPVVGSGSTFYVPDNFSTIQGALSSASVLSGDTIIVRPGLYYENIDFLGKNLKLTSEQGPIVTIIDGNRMGSVVTFDNGELQTCTLEGFTIRNGQATEGGGIYCNLVAPVIKNNSITGSIANKGGGIYMRYANPALVSNNFEGNFALNNGVEDGLGGGIYGKFSNANIISNTVLTNYIDYGFGAGIYLQGGTAMVKHNKIQGNVIYYNYGGGGYASYKSFATVSGNFIMFNVAMQGGGVFCDESGDKFANNMVFGNMAIWGGGFWCGGKELSVTNCTVTANFVPSGGGGGGIFSSSGSLVKNCVIWNNSEFEQFGSPTQVAFSVIEGGYSGMANIDADPLFVDPVNYDFHITEYSVCVNGGTKSGAPQLDIDADPRPHQGTVDIGADEYVGDLPLEADKFSIMASSGGKVNLSLEARPSDAGRQYAVFGSVTGTAPGLLLPLGQATLRCNIDVFTTSYVLPMWNTPVFKDFLGHLDGTSQAAAQFFTPPLPAAAVGITFYYAYTVGPVFDFASNPVAIQVK
jgi:hypothetical protein